MKLHAQLLAGDTHAANLIAEFLLAKLIRKVHAYFRSRDTQLVSDAVTDALLDYINKPHNFDASHGKGLGSFLLQEAQWRLETLQRSERRRVRRQQEFSAACQFEMESVLSAENSQCDRLLNTDAPLEELLAQCAQAFLSPTDHAIIELMARGTRKTEDFASVMGLRHLESDARRKEVKRAKDRISKRLQRQMRNLARKYFEISKESLSNFAFGGALTSRRP